MRPGKRFWPLAVGGCQRLRIGERSEDLQVLRRKRWVIRERLPASVASGLAQLPSELAQVLFNRGVTTPEGADRFLRVETPADSDPMRLNGVGAAVERVLAAIRSAEKIAIYGDYDTDGVTATVLLVRYLRECGALAFPYIPSRFEEGYGLNTGALRKLKEQGYGLVITVDCGVRALEEAQAASQLGLDLVITDHHEPLAELPSALAVIDPKIPDNSYPDKALAGVGVAYKLAQGVEMELRRWPARRGLSLEGYLELVAVGTVADVAPLIGENCSLVHAGLVSLNASGGPRNLGLRKLMDASSLKSGKVTAGAIGFVLGPRLNSAGRVEHAMTAYSLLETDAPQVATQLAALLSSWNCRRQQITRTVTSHARDQILSSTSGERGRELPFFVFASDPSYSPGVTGLAASRLSEEFYRPVAVLAVDLQDGLAKGSARSIPELHLTQVLDECGDLLIRYGGHAAAAGFTVRLEDLPALQARLERLARAELGARVLEPSLQADVIVSFHKLPELASWLKRLEPCGQGNPQPVFVAPKVRVVSKRSVGSDGSHLSLQLREGETTLDAIAFGRGSDAIHLPEEVGVAFRLEEDDFSGVNRLRLNVLDLGDPGAGELVAGAGRGV